MTDDPNRTERGTFALGNQASAIHGGAAAKKAITEGVPFKGVAAATQLEVQNERAARGSLAMVQDDADRFETASRLYWRAFLTACDNGDIVQMTSFLKVLATVTAHAGRLNVYLADKEKDGGKALDYEAVLEQERKQ